MIFEDLFDRVLKAFTAMQVDFMIVGGFAVNYHGYSRNTSDLDLWVKSDSANQANICMALRLLNYNDESIALVAKLDFYKPFLFHIADEPNDVEELQKIEKLK